MLPIYVDVNSQLGQNVKSDLLPDLDAINNSLYNLLMCPIGSRPWQPYYGSRLWEFIHEPCDDVTAFQIEISLIQSIERWETRILLDRIQTFVQPLTRGDGYAVQIVYSVKVSGLRGSLSLNATRQ
jgi:phage baseplate assembly protein W